MSRWLGVLGVVVALGCALGFASLNGTQRITLDLWVVTLYRVPVAFVAFGGIVLGMVMMLVAGVHTDLRVREILRDRLKEEDRTERARIDRNQRDLFNEEED